MIYKGRVTDRCYWKAKQEETRKRGLDTCTTYTMYSNIELEEMSFLETRPRVFADEVEMSDASIIHGGMKKFYYKLSPYYYTKKP